MAKAVADVTQRLMAWREGRQEALNELLPLVYAELRRLARNQLRRAGDADSMQSTALVHEAYLRMIDQERVQWQDRAHFYGVASHLMRGILVDHYRSHHAEKRGGNAQKIPLDEVIPPASADWKESINIIALDDALNRLAALDPQQARIVELRFFGGLSIEETAEVADVSPATVKNRWKLARAWLHRELCG
jgi:RNA polymerase sigma factor (TIGR02999 family)